jgi:hypothetical protein
MPPQALSPNQIVWVEEPCLTLAQASACASGTSRALVTISRINLYLAPSTPCASRADLSRQPRPLAQRSILHRIRRLCRLCEKFDPTQILCVYSPLEFLLLL